MSHLLVPGPAESRCATVWAAAVDERDDPAALEVVAASGPRSSLGRWDYWLEGGKRRVGIRRVRLRGLGPRARERIELQRAGKTVASAMVGTLPDRLPSLEERPFTILLGSCFAQKRDGAGSVGRTYSLLPGDARPDVKILCGDQVYLDAPSFWTIFPAVSTGELRRRLLAAYLESWGQEPGFRTLLADGPNAFTSDDHDFWNNAPNGSITAPSTLIGPLRRAWLEEARRLYRAFQRPRYPRLTIMEMDGLSICVADVRVHRGEGSETFMYPADLKAVREWASNLKGPGCLALGQLLFAPPASRIGRHMDLGLPDYRQYPELVDALARAPFSIVVLTGDVHFGRVAVCELQGGREIVEVVASPMALVAPVPRNDWRPAPALFPAEAIPGHVQRPIRTEAAYQFNGNHFATIGFNRAGGRVRLNVQAWPTDNRGRLPAAVRSYVHWIS